MKRYFVITLLGITCLVGLFFLAVVFSVEDFLKSLAEATA
jgi:hypothetical protein